MEIRVGYKDKWTEWHKVDEDYDIDGDVQVIVDEMQCDLGYSFYDAMGRYFAHDEANNGACVSSVKNLLSFMESYAYDELCCQWLMHIIEEEQCDRAGLRVEIRETEKEGE